MNKVWVTILEDRHCDTGVEVFESEKGALAFAMPIVAEEIAEFELAARLPNPEDLAPYERVARREADG